MQNDKFFRMLGLAVRAGSVAFGEGAVRDSIRSKVAKMVIVSQDGSDNTKKKFSDNCRFYSVPYFECSNRFDLGKATGRSFAVVMAVTNDGLAKGIIDILQN
ncbi:MAG: ribosomal L7Ae/L30e/S12e/Gadd45 family protein [Clostridia bacterium]|nr:ribosomal L7Ae/L30e/S12e/Gadd45 family protein [Clostridia bacterium]